MRIRRKRWTAHNDRTQHSYLPHVRDLVHVPIREIGVEVRGLAEHGTAGRGGGVGTGNIEIYRYDEICAYHQATVADGGEQKKAAS